jgi:hypothetical protein
MSLCTGLVILYGVNAFATTLINSKITLFHSHGFRPLNRLFLRHIYPVHVSLDTLCSPLSSLLADEFKNDPRNPASKTQKPADKR